MPPSTDAAKRLAEILAREEFHPRVRPRPWWQEPLGWFTERAEHYLRQLRELFPSFDGSEGPLLPQSILELVGVGAEVTGAALLLYLLYRFIRNFRLPGAARSLIRPVPAVTPSPSIKELVDAGRHRELLCALREELRRKICRSMPLDASATDRQIARMPGLDKALREPFCQTALSFERLVFAGIPLDSEAIAALARLAAATTAAGAR